MPPTTRSVLWKAVSVPLLGLGAAALLALAIGWWTLLRSVPSGPGLSAALAAAAAALLAAGLAPWGRAHARNVAGLLALGVGCQSAMVAAVFALTLGGGLGGLLPTDVDVPTYREVAVAATASAGVLVSIGLVLLAPATGRLVRRIRASDRPVLVFAVLAWELHVGVSALASIGLMQAHGDLLPPDLQRYLADARPHAAAWSLGLAALGLAGAALLVRFRRSALWPLGAQAVLRVAYLVLSGGLAPPPGVPALAWIVAVAHGPAIEATIVGYVARLRRRGHLR